MKINSKQDIELVRAQIEALPDEIKEEVGRCIRDINEVVAPYADIGSIALISVVADIAEEQGIYASPEEVDE